MKISGVVNKTLALSMALGTVAATMPAGVAFAASETLMPPISEETVGADLENASVISYNGESATYGNETLNVKGNVSGNAQAAGREDADGNKYTATLNITGDAGYVMANTNATVTVGGDVTDNIDVMNNSSVDVGGNAYGRVWAANNSTASIAENVTINETEAKGSTFGVVAAAGSSIIVYGDADITLDKDAGVDDYYIGIYGVMAASTEEKGTATAVVYGDVSAKGLADGDYTVIAVNAYKNADVNVVGNVSAEGGAQAYGLQSKDGGTISVGGDVDGDIKLSNSGDIIIKGKATGDVTLDGTNGILLVEDGIYGALLEGDEETSATATIITYLVEDVADSDLDLLSQVNYIVLVTADNANVSGTTAYTIDGLTYDTATAGTTLTIKTQPGYEVVVDGYEVTYDPETHTYSVTVTDGGEVTIDTQHINNVPDLDPQEIIDIISKIQVVAQATDTENEADTSYEPAVASQTTVDLNNAAAELKAAATTGTAATISLATEAGIPADYLRMVKANPSLTLVVTASYKGAEKTITFTAESLANTEITGSWYTTADLMAF